MFHTASASSLVLECFSRTLYPPYMLLPSMFPESRQQSYNVVVEKPCVAATPVCGHGAPKLKLRWCANNTGCRWSYDPVLTIGAVVFCISGIIIRFGHPSEGSGLCASSAFSCTLKHITEYSCHGHLNSVN